MSRLAALLVCVSLCGCGDPSSSAPMLSLKIERQDGKANSRGRYRVFNTGMLSESGDSVDDGKNQSQRVTINKIAGDTVNLSFEISDGAGGDFAKEISLRHGEQIEVDLPNQSKLLARLEAAD